MSRLLKFPVTLLAACGMLLVGSAARASSISLYGDIDCFGLPGVSSCPDGSSWETGLGGVFFTDYRSPAEQLAGSVTDIWASPTNVSWTQPAYSTAGATSAILTMRIAGIADIVGPPWTVSFDGTAVGVIPRNLVANAFQDVLTYSFSVPIGLLTGTDTVMIGTGGGDGFSIDYSQLTVNTVAAVPEPASLLLLGTGLSVLARRRLKKRK